MTSRSGWMMEDSMVAVSTGAAVALTHFPQRDFSSQ
jgi:hypothetical protein